MSAQPGSATADHLSRASSVRSGSAAAPPSHAPAPAPHTQQPHEHQLDAARQQQGSAAAGKASAWGTPAAPRQHAPAGTEPNGKVDLSKLTDAELESAEAQRAIEAEIQARNSQRASSDLVSSTQALPSGVQDSATAPQQQQAPQRAHASWAQCAGSPAKGGIRGMARTKAAGSAGNLARSTGSRGSRATSLASEAQSHNTEEEDLIVDTLLRDSDAIQQLVAMPDGVVALAGAANGAGSNGAYAAGDAEEAGVDESRLEVVGLHNPGYLCFMNASAQALLGASALGALMRALRGCSELLMRARAPTLAAFAAFVESMELVQGAGVTGESQVRAGNDTLCVLLQQPAVTENVAREASGAVHVPGVTLFKSRGRSDAASQRCHVHVTVRECRARGGRS